MQSIAIVVDDNSRVVTAMTRMLHSNGFDTVAFTTFDQAMRDIALTSPRVAFIDYILDRGNSGAAVVDHVRHLFGNQLLIGMVTAYGTEHISSQCLRVDQIFAKPVTTSAISAFLRCSITHHLHLSGHVSHTLSALADYYELSTQEFRVLANVASGSTRTNLALDIGISSNTVKGQVRQLLKKMECDCLSDLSSMLMRRLNRESQ